MQRIAIHTADLDHDRIDGTRVYSLSVLRYLGKLAPTDRFFLYHKRKYNPKLTPENFSNYKVKKLWPLPFWTQSVFAWQIWRDKPNALWMPVHNLPMLRRKKLRTVVTIHDLAFKYFPEHFPKKDLRKLNLLTDNAIKNSTSLIAISNSTKRDILKFYPEVDEKKISVVYHGFDADLFEREIPQAESDEILKSYKLEAKSYFLYVGAIQPRKNLETLITAFEKLHAQNFQLKLVLVGEKAWSWEGVMEKIENSISKENIVLTGSVPFEKLPIFYQNAIAFVFPSLYEGFGIPLLEAMASGAPVVCADNSCLSEVGADAPLYFESKSSYELIQRLKSILEDDNLRKNMIEKGKRRVRDFSWEKCAKQTLDIIRKKEYN